jgi:hypothetical protein
VTSPRLGALLAIFLLAYGPAFAVEARSGQTTQRVGPPFELRDLPEATDGYRAIVADPFAEEFREKLAGIYEREGFRSVAAFYRATAESLRKRKAFAGESLSDESWRCPVVDVESEVDRVSQALADRDLKKATSLARALYDSHRHACEGSLLWAWTEMLWNRPTPDLEKKELATRTLITAAEDGLRFPQHDPPGSFDVYYDLALCFLAHQDPVSAAVAAKRAEIRGWSPNMEVTEDTLRFLRELEDHPFVRAPGE